MLRRALAAWLSFRRPAAIATRHGFDLYVPPEDRSPIVVSLILEGEYEPEETRAIQELLRPGDVAIDIGANIGYMSCLMGRLVGDEGSVHAFEPEPRHAEALERNAELNHLGQIRCRRKALSRDAGNLPLYLDPENPGDHTLVAIAGRDSVEVDTLSFDSYWNGADEARSIRLVKIDVQGHEAAVIDGMQKTLAAGRIDMSLLEIAEGLHLLHRFVRGVGEFLV